MRERSEHGGQRPPPSSSLLQTREINSPVAAVAVIVSTEVTFPDTTMEVVLPPALVAAFAFGLEVTDELAAEEERVAALEPEEEEDWARARVARSWREGGEGC